MKAAIYARYSSDLQSDRSIDDQVALCRRHVESAGGHVTAVFDDRARSGASILGRAGLASLMTAAREGEFDAVVVEHLDRISRDQEDLAHLFKRLRFLGISLIEVHGGTATSIQVGVRGLVGALYLEDLAQKITRGMSGVVREGRAAGGLAYGYRAVLGQPGVRVIDEDQAPVVRWIFERYASGDTARTIAHVLNQQGRPPPRGRLWQASAIIGSRKRENGILRNRLYVGMLVWGRCRMIKDPDTGRKVSRPAEPAVRQETPVPALAIVPQAMFNQVQARLEVVGGGRPDQQRKAKRLLSGLLRCGICGGGMSAKGKIGGIDRIRCTGQHENGVCAHKRSYRLPDVEGQVLDGLAKHLRDPRLIAEYAHAYQAERRRLAGAARSQRAALEKRLAEVVRDRDRTVDLLIKGVIDESLGGTRVRAFEAERIEIEGKLAAADRPDDIVTLHPAAVNRYLAQLEILGARLAGGTIHATDSAAGIMRELIDRVVITPSEGKSFGIEIKGRLSALLGPGTLPQPWGGMLVVEEGFEPPTYGL